MSGEQQLRAVQAMQHVVFSYDAGRVRASIPVTGYDTSQPQKTKMVSEFEPITLSEDVDEMWERYETAKDKVLKKLLHAVSKIVVDMEKRILMN